jgi:hypothetical protein
MRGGHAINLSMPPIPIPSIDLSDDLAEARLLKQIRPKLLREVRLVGRDAPE